MSSLAVDLFLASLEDLRKRMEPGAQSGDEVSLTFADEAQQQRADRFRTDLVEVLGDPALAETWTPESLSTEEVFSCYAFLAQAYLVGADERRRPYLRRMMVVIRDLGEQPDYILRALPVIAEAPVERWEILAHGGIQVEAAKARYEDRWPSSRAQIDETAERLTQPDAEPGANYHVKFLKDMGLVKVSKKPRLADQLKGDARDLWLFVKLTDEGVRFLWMLGYG